MIRLVQTFGAHAGRTREFDQNVITFGRLPSNDVAFDPHADLDASGAHAEIRREGDAWVLVDSRSRNGTLIQGRVIQRHTLAHGDEIEFGTGGPRMRVEFAKPAPAPAPAAGMHTMPATPIEVAVQSLPKPSEPKLYGQQTFDAAVEAAAARAAAGSVGASATPAPSSLPMPNVPRSGTAVMPQAYGHAPPVPAPLPAPPYLAGPGNPPPVVVPSPSSNTSSVWILVLAIAGLGCLSFFCMAAAGVIYYVTSAQHAF